jgi:N-acetylmuramoyl-L-alanine amidase
MVRSRCAAAFVGALLLAGCTSGATTTPTTSIHSTPTRPAQVSTPTGPPISSSSHPPAASSNRPSVRGLLVVLNPGHDGGNAAHAAEISRLVPAGFGQTKACDTTGTETPAGYPEHAFNWDVAMRVQAILRTHGVRVRMTRPDDSGVGPCVDARAAIGNEPGVAATVSIHADGTPDGSGRGFHICEESARPTDTAVAARSRALAVALHDALVRSSGLVPSTYVGTNGYFPRSDLAALNLATGPATFLELGNMRNAEDAALLSSASGRQQIAAAVAAGILTYLGG